MDNYDVTVIGAGIIGLATAYKLLEFNPSMKICILEKENGVAFHQTGHNSGVIHSGIYYKPGSLKAVNCITGYNMLLEFCDENNIPYDICGKIIVATQEKEIPPLKTLYERGIANGLSGTKLISADEIKEHEPEAAGIQGIYVPQTGIVDYKAVSEKIYEKLKSAGSEVRFGEEVISINSSDTEPVIATRKNKYSSKAVIGCAGLYSDKIAQMTGSETDFRIIPFRGEYYKLKDSARHLVKNLIYPVPDPEFPFLGVHFTRRIDGMIEAGPNAVLAFKKEGYVKSDFSLSETLNTLSYTGFHKVAAKYWKTGFYEFRRSFSKNEFVNSLQKLIPAIKSDDIEKGGSGVRAQACDSGGKLIDDFMFVENGNFINVCNAPSPAATSCFSIGKTIAEKILKKCFD
ncbi:MAG: L-2-hydroxyglutarate oxidase [Ignavibacteria bacterium]|nr:L-2-hydroxyglutarate oxidase [Ignavibacteria bacterium]